MIACPPGDAQSAVEKKNSDRFVLETNLPNWDFNKKICTN